MTTDPATSVTPVEQSRALLDAETDRQRHLSESVAGVLIGALLGAAAGTVPAAVLASGASSPALIIGLFTVIGAFVGVVVGLGFVGVRAQAAREEFAEVRQRARKEKPVRYRRPARR